jgi:ATP-binding cassette subfamily C (CFTR/MRP) protein 1
VGCQAWVALWTAQASVMPPNHTETNTTTTPGADESQAATTASATAQNEVLWYIGVYALLSFGAIVCVLAQQLSCVALAVGASSRVHAKAFRAVVRAPLAFFETTPTGRILARFGNDMNVVDTMLMNSLNSSGSQLCVLLVVFVMNACLVPWLAPISVPLFLLYASLASLYRRSSRELKRLENIAETPVYSGFASCMDGLLTIRAFRGSADRLVTQTDQTINDWVACWLKNNIANRWMGVRLDLIGACLSGSVGVFGVLWAGGVIGDASATFSAGLVGLMLSFTASQATMLNWMVRGVAEAEQHATSLERCLTMANVRPERWGDEEDRGVLPPPPSPAAAVEHLTSTFSPHGCALSAAAGPAGSHSEGGSWPSVGAIEIKDLCMRYRPGMPRVLNSVSLSIRGGERVGVCGRTGSGKSSLSKCLLRLVEFDGGEVFIDGRAATQMPLAQLRGAMAMVQQDPSLFSGSLRHNVDPTGAYGEASVCDALASASLSHLSLDGNIDEGGANLSAGERQLVCLARVLLVKPRILLLDEATSSLDRRTDGAVQAAVRALKGVTILAIAHRLETLMDYDTIVVLDQGRVVEVGPPKQLAAKPEGVFASLLMRQRGQSGEDMGED